MIIKVTCRHCGSKFEIEIHTFEGYISFVDKGAAKYNRMTDSFATVDLYCSDSCKEN